MSAQEPTARLMIRALRGFEEELQRRLYADGFQDVSVAQTNVLRHLNPEGMRLSELAADAGITKQGGSQAVKLLAARGLVAVESDESDRRAKRVVYTERGRALIACALAHIVVLEQEWSDRLGQDRFEALRSALVDLTDQAPA